MADTRDDRCPVAFTGAAPVPTTIKITCPLDVPVQVRPPRPFYGPLAKLVYATHSKCVPSGSQFKSEAGYHKSTVIASYD